jgi:3-oxoadipate enol-lactonase
MPDLVGCFMPFLVLGSYRIRFELDGPEHGPAYVLVNGLTQYAELWGAYRDTLVAKGFRVATFDLLGQGASDKPALAISQDDQVAALSRFSSAVSASAGSLRCGTQLSMATALPDWLS